MWQLDGTVAKLAVAVAGGGVSVDVTRPSVGLAWRMPASTIAALNALGVVLNDAEPLDPASIDTFARGRDLVAAYAERPPRHVRAQIYWRHLTPDDFAPVHQQHITAAFDLILSVNTSVLDENPQSVVRSIISPANEVLNLRISNGGQLFTEIVGRDGAATTRQPSSAASTPTGCFLLRLPGSGLSYVEMVHPIDYQQSDVLTGDSAPPRTQLSHQLFAQRLEKGVILRARVRAALVEGEHDEAAMIAAFQQFSAAEPPLTV